MLQNSILPISSVDVTDPADAESLNYPFLLWNSYLNVT